MVTNLEDLVTFANELANESEKLIQQNLNEIEQPLYNKFYLPSSLDLRAGHDY